MLDKIRREDQWNGTKAVRVGGRCGKDCELCEGGRSQFHCRFEVSDNKEESNFSINGDGKARLGRIRNETGGQEGRSQEHQWEDMMSLVPSAVHSRR